MSEQTRDERPTLRDWALETVPGDDMLWKGAYGSQIMFLRDTFGALMRAGARERTRSDPRAVRRPSLSIDHSLPSWFLACRRRGALVDERVPGLRCVHHRRELPNLRGLGPGRHRGRRRGPQEVHSVWRRRADNMLLVEAARDPVGVVVGRGIEYKRLRWRHEEREGVLLAKRLEHGPIALDRQNLLDLSAQIVERVCEKVSTDPIKLLELAVREEAPRLHRDDVELGRDQLDEHTEPNRSVRRT